MKKRKTSRISESIASILDDIPLSEISGGNASAFQENDQSNTTVCEEDISALESTSDSTEGETLETFDAPVVDPPDFSIQNEVETNETTEAETPVSNAISDIASEVKALQDEPQFAEPSSETIEPSQEKQPEPVQEKDDYADVQLEQTQPEINVSLNTPSYLSTSDPFKSFSDHTTNTEPSFDQEEPTSKPEPVAAPQSQVETDVEIESTEIPTETDKDATSDEDKTPLTEIELFDEQVSVVYSQIAKLAGEVTSKSAFYKQALEMAAKPFSSPYATIYVNLGSEVVEHSWYNPQSHPDFWEPIVNNFQAESLSHNQSNLRFFTTKRAENNISVALISTPIRSASGSQIGCIVMVIRCVNQNHAKANLTVMESMASLISCCGDTIGVIATGPGQATSKDQSTLGKLLTKLAGYSSQHELAFALTNNLRNKTDCELVALGLIVHKKAKIVSISGQDEVKTNSPDVAVLQEVMEECYDMDDIIMYQAQRNEYEDEQTGGHRIHKQWHESSNKFSVASIPLHSDEGYVTVISLKRNGNNPFTLRELEKIREMTQPYAAAFTIVDRANRNLLSHSFEVLRSGMHELVQPSAWTKKIMTACFVIFMSWFIFGSMEYRVTVPATIVPAEIRHMATPESGILKEISAIKGQQVSKGDILCVFKHDTLLLERKQYMAQYEMAKIEEKKSISKNAVTEARIARANKDLAKAKLDIVNKKIDQAIIRAPFDGLVVEGDLRKRVGEILPQGEPLFELASSNNWMLELKVPEYYSIDIDADLKGKFATNAKPDITHDLTVLRINPKGEVVDTKNIYKGDAEVTMNEPWVKAGMEGVAKISVEDRPVWWVTFHRMINFVRLKLWL